MTATAYDRSGRAWLRSLNCDGRYGLALAATLLLVVVLAAGGEPWQLALRYERTALAAGQWWRLATAHVVHLGARHALLDAAGLVLLWILYARALGARQWAAALGGSLLAIDAGLWWLSPEVGWYVGLSGLLHGAWAAGALGAWQTARRHSTLSLALLAAKLIAEQWLGTGVASSGLPVIVAAHLYGALGGLAGAWAVRGRAARL
ncbi:MAG: rhombosortase [Gammaproteobacteria bacterium]|nr:rhombosortase [Gammaproteobacteria bacterium]